MAAAIGDNSAVVLPSDKSEAARVLYNRLVKLYADRRAYADSARDMLKDAKVQYKANARVIRLGHRLSRLTPEKREKWAQEMSEAACMFGYSKMDVADANREGHNWNLVQNLAMIEGERKEIADHVKELLAYARERGDLDVKSIQYLARMSRKDKDELADEWANLDTIATFLGLW